MKLVCKLLLCWLLLGGQSFAQKLPDIQKEGIRPPKAVKIDGHLDEWEGLSAYNNRTYIYYTVANDDENLYLAIKSPNSLITSKILQGGLTFSVNSSGKRQKNDVAITYPVVGEKEIQTIQKYLPRGISDDARMSPSQKKEALKQWEATMAEADRKSINIFKFINVAGVTQITEKQLPIYNESAIKVAMTIDKERALNYEMALPLKYLNLTLPTAPLYYNIKLRGKYVPAGVTLNPIKTQDGGPPLGEGGVDLRSLMVDTDFWGAYVLVK